MAAQHYDHVIYVLVTPDGQRYAYHEALSNFEDYHQDYELPHSAKQLRLDTRYRTWKGLCHIDPYFESFTPVSKQELVEIHRDAFPQAPIKRVVNDDDDDDKPKPAKKPKRKTTKRPAADQQPAAKPVSKETQPSSKLVEEPGKATQPHQQPAQPTMSADAPENTSTEPGQNGKPAEQAAAQNGSEHGSEQLDLL